MNEENINEWIPQPDVCRFCLLSNGSWDITATYITEAGNKEVFTEMLQECYGIGLSYLTQWGPSRLVCRMCVGHLRDAFNFKKQVLNAEKLFSEYFSRQDNVTAMQIKTELQSLEAKSPESFIDDTQSYGDTSIQDVSVSKKTDMKTKKTAKEIHSRKRKKCNLKAKRKRKVLKIDDIDSDTPISTLRNRTNKLFECNNGKETQNITKSGAELFIKTSENEKTLKIQDFSKSEIVFSNLLSRKDVETQKNNLNDENGAIVETCRNELINVGINLQRLQAQAGIKLVSERKRVIITCDTVLRDTTACPFRHHKSWFQCFFCTQDFIEINRLRHHTLSIHADIDAELKKIKRYPRSLQIEISNLECRHCCTSLSDVETMRRHLIESHKKVLYTECIADYKVDSSPYTCHLCGKQYHVFRTLTTHLNEHYANCICDVCGKSFLNTKRLKVHKRTHENGQYPCSECGKVLKTKTSKANHMESAHSKRIIKCQICFKPMKHYNHRIKHMSEVHDITHKFKCPICPREYNIKHYLATHIRQTHGHKNKKCGDCGMAFITNHGLKKHMLRHTGVKAYTCSVCCKSYARSYTLKEHMRAHETEAALLGA